MSVEIVCIGLLSSGSSILWYNKKKKKKKKNNFFGGHQADLLSPNLVCMLAIFF
jgi:hypothetical protein